MSKQSDKEYTEILVDAIRVCAFYKPKLGHGGKQGYSFEDFQQIYRNDPFYSWMGLDNPLMYAAHKAAGGMTSIYRQIGIGCEKLFRRIIKDTLQLQDEDVLWSYQIAGPGGKMRKLSLDGRILIDKLPSGQKRDKVQNWIMAAASELDIDEGIRDSIKGIVFEIRQGYKSKDSKRQNADIANAATAYTKGYLPCVGVLSLQIDEDIALRYRAAKWIMLTGIVHRGTPQNSFYHFMKDIVGYDLAAFFKRNQKILRDEINRVLQSLLKLE